MFNALLRILSETYMNSQQLLDQNLSSVVLAGVLTYKTLIKAGFVLHFVL